MTEYGKKIDKLLEENLTEQAFSFWKVVKVRLPDVGGRLTSSSKKYHKRGDGTVPNLDEHVYEMLNSGNKIYRLFYDGKTGSHKDAVLLSIVFHDTLKYGPDGLTEHTLRNHDSLAGDVVQKNKDTFLRFLNIDEFNILEEAVRYHSGRWSADLKEQKINFKEYNPETLFLHMLDMLSTSDCLKG